jgi:hypothetical protein
MAICKQLPPFQFFCENIINASRVEKEAVK